MKDFIGNELKIGDDVVVTISTYSSRALALGKVTKLTQKRIGVTYNHGYEDTILTVPCMVMRMPT